MTTDADILQILEGLGITLGNYKVINGGSEIQADCPYHEDRNLHFYLNVDKLVYKCHKCGISGHITQLIQDRTNLTLEQAQAALQGIPQSFTNREVEQRGRYLSDNELDILTNYCNGLSALMLGKLKGIDSGQWLEYLHGRGFDNETIEYFKLGANSMKGYGAYFINQMSNYDRKTKEILESLKLITDKGDYWYKPSVIIPYYSSGQCYFANARILPRYADGLKYVLMSGLSRTQFFNDDALDQYDALFCVEGEFNAMSFVDYDQR